jgi:hypothetical protein
MNKRCLPIEEARLLDAVKRVMGNQVTRLRMPPIKVDDKVDPFSPEDGRPRLSWQTGFLPVGSMHGRPEARLPSQPGLLFSAARGLFTQPRPSAATESRDDFAHHFAMHIREPEIAACVAVGEFLVVEAEELQDCRVQVVDVDGFFHGLESELVGRSVDVAALHAAAGHPEREAVVVVVASVFHARVV